MTKNLRRIILLKPGKHDAVPGMKVIEVVFPSISFVYIGSLHTRVTL